MSEEPNASSVYPQPGSNGCKMTADQVQALVEGSEAFKHLQWQYRFAQRRFNQLVTLLESRVDGATVNEIIRQLGCECAKTVSFVQEHIGDLEGYWAEIEARWGEKATFDRERGIITIATPERDCVCPVVSHEQTAPSFCDCSLGWQKQVYETLTGRPVEVELKESVLRGSKRCAFEIRFV
jgi:predicted ArsR family transcriptional regulator